MKDLQQHWDEFGRVDPLWAILTDESKKGNRWDLAEFLATGEADVNTWLGWIQKLGVRRGSRRAMDFGCGVGRLTRPLAARFREVVGVDIAPSMIVRAQELNRQENVRFVVNDGADLSQFPDGSFDLVFSFIVLQHIQPEYTRRYLEEFARVLAPGGVLAFQLPGGLRPLPDGMFRARLEALESPGRMTAGALTRVRARVVNTSDCTWPPGNRLRLGNHWWRDEELLLWDDGRARVPPLAPGQSADIALDVVPPRRPGPLELELDLVAEGVAWFAHRGSPTVRTTVEVGDDGAAPADDGTAERQPVMEMHTIPRDEVIGLLQAADMRVVAAEVRTELTPWFDYSYVAVKRTWAPWERRGRLLARWALPLPVRRALKRGLRHR
jgi:SAM-dependent methyltransferase